MFRPGCWSHVTAGAVVGGMCFWLISVFQVQASLLSGDTRHHHIQPHHARSNKSGQYVCRLPEKESRVIVGARLCRRYQWPAGVFVGCVHVQRFKIHLEWKAPWLYFLPLAVHSLGTCPHPSPVATRASVKLQSIAIRFEPLRPEKGHAKNSTAKRFRETTNPEIKLSLFCFYFLSQSRTQGHFIRKFPLHLNITS